MKEQRQQEIASAVLVWQLQQIGTERFMGMLKEVGEEKGIAEAEMFEFFKESVIAKM